MLGLGFLFHFYNPPSPPPQTTPTTPNYRILFNQATTICNTNPLHFIIISILFIPLTFSTAAALELYIFSADVTTILQTLTTFKTLTTLIFVIISTVTGVALTTFTAHQTIRRTPVTFTSIFKSLSSSFIPLLSTFVAGMIKVIKLALISLVITFFGLWFHFKQLMISFVLVLTLVFYMITWGLAPAIAVLESKSGFEQLRECAKYKSVMFCSKFLYMVCNTGVLIWGIFSTPIVEKIGKLEKLLIAGKATLVDDDGQPIPSTSSTKRANPFSKVGEIEVSDSEDEVVANPFDESANIFGGGQGYEDEYDEYDFDDYAKQVRDLPGNLDAFNAMYGTTFQGPRK